MGMQRSEIVYISGPMTGIKDFNAPLFNFVAFKLRELGYEVINPVELDGEADKSTLTWEMCLRRDIELLMSAAQRRPVIIATLPEWYISKGARLEVFVAATVGLPVMPYEDLLLTARGVA
jgi:hypothetical protein